MLTKACLQALLLGLMVATVDTAQAAAPAATTITCHRMCPKCGQKISEKLQMMPGVAGAQLNVEAKTIVVVAQPQHALSPRTLWEAVENGGEQPVSLHGPAGSFTQKPPF
ncbi:MAG: heavy-metal-associated domain-containing protein [Planctomycetales bacterium]|nr:heavy-metal-associated domain-containing protein [Planctomycetales bacterium]MBN8627009.1 heavy-metal-associated domain-containing protein [Planctomycetota bacterium]